MLLLPAEVPFGSGCWGSPMPQVQGPNAGAVTILRPQLGVEVGSLSSPCHNSDVVLQAALGTCLPFYVPPHGGPPVLCHSVWSTPKCKYASSLCRLPLCLDRGCPPALRSTSRKLPVNLPSLGPLLLCTAVGFSAVVVRSTVLWSSGEED